MSYYDNRLKELLNDKQKEVNEILEHIKKVRNRSLRKFLLGYFWLDAFYYALDLPNKEVDKEKMLYHVENILYVLKEPEFNFPLISERTAYDFQHGYIAISKINELSEKLFRERVLSCLKHSPEKTIKAFKEVVGGRQ